MKTPEEIQKHYEDAEKRFVTAASSGPPTNEQKNSLAVLLAATVELGALILEHTPQGRDQSIALTSLEDTLMRANRGLFSK